MRGISQAIGAFVAGYGPEDSEEGEDTPFDRKTVDPDDEPNLFPPDPHENWDHLKQQALIQGDLDTAENIVTPVVYSGTRNRIAQWEPLSFQEIKKLRQAITDHGIGSPFFTIILESVLAAHTMTLHDLRMLVRLLLTPALFALWEKEWERGEQNLLVTVIN